MARSLVARVLAAIAAVGLRLFFRTIEFHGFDRIPRGRPMLVVANHFNGFVDAVLLIRGLATVPRFLARSGLWRTAAIRPFLALVGLIPVYRPEDGSDATKNVSLFSKTEVVLVRGGLVAVFPEGRTHDEPGMIRVRTGAARIALGARVAGAAGLVIVPVGLVFDNKVALRDRAAVRVGQPIDLDAEIAAFVEEGEAEGEENFEAVRRLTEEIERRLLAVTTEFATLREQAVLRRAAEIRLRSEADDVEGDVEDDVSLDARERLAGRMAQAPPDKRQAVADALGAYTLDLEILDVRDFQLLPRYRNSRHLRRALLETLKVVVLAPLAIAGFLLNVVPFWVVRQFGISQRPAMRGTYRLYVILVFPLFWLCLVVGVGFAVSFWAALFATVPLVFVAPALGILALHEIDDYRRVNDAWRAWGTYRERSLPIEPTVERRQRVLACVNDALASVPPA
ncbi:MAG: 1-acyl-sn-glycerol-3-phosphate acyltransferase [Acidimicrobiia bacterium]|nr:1-acyl-sn-glycerol-3-phosphate acyltransferase [Acidimicrobiia bacterium]